MKAIKQLYDSSAAFQSLKPVYDGLQKIKFEKPRAKYKAEHEAELKQFYAARRKLTGEFPDGKVDMKKLTEEYDELEQAHEQAPHQRPAQRALARHMTELVHGAAAVSSVEQAATALFGQGDVRALAEDMLRDVFADVPHSSHSKALLDGAGISLLDLLVDTSLAQSKREAREFLQNGAIAVNGEKADLERKLNTSDLLHGHTILLRRGKKNWHATRWA